MNSKIYDDVPMADARKPDRDEPFRYESSCCGQMVSAKQETLTGYRCNGCGKKYLMDELVDKKYDTLVGQRAVGADD